MRDLRRIAAPVSISTPRAESVHKEARKMAALYLARFNEHKWELFIMTSFLLKTRTTESEIGT